MTFNPDGALVFKPIRRSPMFGKFTIAGDKYTFEFADSNVDTGIFADGKIVKGSVSITSDQMTLTDDRVGIPLNYKKADAPRPNGGNLR